MGPNIQDYSGEFSPEPCGLFVIIPTPLALYNLTLLIKVAVWSPCYFVFDVLY